MGLPLISCVNATALSKYLLACDARLLCAVLLGEGIRDSHNELPSIFVVNVNYFFNPQSCKGLLKRLTIYFRTYIILQVTLKTAL